MGDRLQKPYEISIWEDILVNEENKTYYKEVKIATIGSDMMTAPSRVHDPIFTQNVNGEITLTFNIVHRYYDDLQDKFIFNPLEKYLINERKVKLFYDNEWYDFIIKSCEEDSDSNVFKFTCKGIFVNELGKVGYSIVLSNDLNNNQGTIFELAEKAVKGTDWIIDKENSDIIQQFVAEPLYIYKNNNSFIAIDLTNNSEVEIQAEETLFVFYSTVANSQEENVFFLRQEDFAESTLDDNNVAQMTNYRFKDSSPASYNEDKTTITIGNIVLTKQTSEDNPTGINVAYQGYRLAYNPQVGYDTVKERPVTLYKATYDDGSEKTIYKYTDYEYVTSDVVTNYITDGAGFNVYTDGSMAGWSAATPGDKQIINRTISTLKIGDELGKQFSITNFSELIANIRIGLWGYVTDELSTFVYRLNTTNGYIQFTYRWTDSSNDTLRLIINVQGGTERDVTFNRFSKDYQSIIEGIGKLTSIEATPVVVQSTFEEAFGSNVYFTTSQEGGKYVLPTLDLITYPNITGSSVLNLTQLNGVKGYLRTQFLGKGGAKTFYSNCIYNEGIGDHREEIGSFSKGEEYIFRVSYGVTTENGGQPTITSDYAGKVKAVVAKYTMNAQEIYDEETGKSEQIYLYTPDPKDILFEFKTGFTVKNNIIDDGYFRTDDNGEYVAYYRDGVSVTPSVDYIYKEQQGNTVITRVWDSARHVFTFKDDKFLDYYYATAKCQKAISNTVLADEGNNYGIFLYTDDDNLVSTKENPIYVYFKEIQFFKKKLDGNGDLVLIGNIPQSTANATDFYYLKPEEDTEEANIETFSTLEAIAESLALTTEDIQLLYNENYEKISSIEASQSNCFNIIQDLCEAFECWAKFDIAHEENGAIRLNRDGAPTKKISFHKYSGDDNFAGFKYGINLGTIQRNLESDEFVSKLIVEQVQNDTVEGGTVSIAGAPSNPSGESYILNMSYYLNHGLIEDSQEYYKDYNNFIEQLKNINTQYTAYKTQLQLATIARSQAAANVNVYSELVDEAKKNLTESVFEFKDLTGIEYNNYVAGNGYSITFKINNTSSEKNITVTFSKILESIVPSFYASDGEEILVDEVSSVEAEETVTKKYYINSDNIKSYVYGDIKYIGIVNEVEGFKVTNADGSYSSYINTFPSLPAIVSQYTKYIWETKNTNTRIADIVPADDHESLTSLVGKIYTNQQAIDDYTPLLELNKEEKANLDLTIDGTKNYTLLISTVSKVIDDIEYNSTKEILDDYIEGLSFTLVNNQGSWDVDTSVTEKAFSQDRLYTSIIFKKYPKNYKLKYTINGAEVITDRSVKVNLITNGSKSFTLVPINETKGIKDNMEDLLDQKDEVEAAFYKKYSRYIQEGSWTSQDYIDNELYYLDALNVSRTSAQPKVSYSLSVYEISEQDGLTNYKFKVGDKTYIEDVQFFGYRNSVYETSQQFTVENNRIILPENVTDVTSIYRDLDHYIRNYIYDFTNNVITFFVPEEGGIPDNPPVAEGEELYVRYSYVIETPIREEVVVSEVEWHLDDNSENSITIQNYKTQFDDLFSRVAAAVQSVEYNSASYSRAASMLDEGGFINAGLLLKSLNELAGGFSLSGDNTITAAEDGIIVKDLIDPMRQMKIAGAGLKTSTDGGYNWNTVITADGLTINTIDTQNVIIKDGDNPSFRWDKYGLNAYGFNTDQTDLKTYVRFDKYGLYGVLDGEDFQAQSLSDIKDTAQFGLLWDGFFIKNSYTDGYVSISSDNDFQVVANDQERIKIGALTQTGDGYEYGIRITNAEGLPVFVTDDSGNIEMTGTINATGGTFTDSVKVGSSENSIILQGTDNDAVIGSSQYFSDPSKGWAIKSDGDAVFNNITARGAIKTAVFEYEEIEAVGGIFIFRPSSTIKSAEIPTTINPVYIKVVPEGESPDDYDISDEFEYFVLEGTTYIPVENPVKEDIDLYYYASENPEVVYSDDLLLRVENPLLFTIGDWCKVSNYNTNDPTDALKASGLSNVYEVVDITDGVLTLHGGAAMFEDVIRPSDDTVSQGYITGDDNVYTLTVIEEENNLEEEVPLPTLTERFFYNFYWEANDQSLLVGLGVPNELIFTENQTTYTIKYIGNLALWNNEQEDTGENFLVIQLNGITSLYVDETSYLYKADGASISENLVVHTRYNISYEIESLVGGALISFANMPYNNVATAEAGQAQIDESRIDVNDYMVNQNYGIGINSSDSAVNLPARAISLFESEISPEENIKVNYVYRGILGTLPYLPYGADGQVHQLYHDNLENTQGVFTDNIYIGNQDQYLTFYTDENGDKHLKISAKEIIFGYDPTTEEEITWEDKIEESNIQSIALEYILSSSNSEVIPIPLTDEETGSNYVLSTDVIANPTTIYYKRIGSGTEEDPYTYQEVRRYILTEDTEGSDEKAYYERSGEGTEEDPYTYTLVEVTEDMNPHDLGYYEEDFSFNPSTEGYYVYVAYYYEWDSIIPQWRENTYLWIRQNITYKDNTNSYSEPWLDLSWGTNNNYVLEIEEFPEDSGFIPLTAHLYINGSEVTDDYEGSLFSWVIKSETPFGLTNETEHILGTGKIININVNNFAYSATIVCSFKNVTKNINLYRENAIKNDIQSVSTDNYFTSVGNGVFIYPYGMPSNPTDANAQGVLIQDNVYAISKGNRVASFGEVIELNGYGAKVKLIIDNNELKFVDTADESKVIASFGIIEDTQGGTNKSQITLGKFNNSVWNVISSDSLQFMTEEGPIASFGKEANSNMWSMNISTARVEDRLYFGNFVWISRDNGNISLKWIEN